FLRNAVHSASADEIECAHSFKENSHFIDVADVLDVGQPGALRGLRWSLLINQAFAHATILN
ncbi:MAG: hypothetical protein VXZ53_12490, partial [Planctomycetota bacterium]|nr:hypothetical protein [Planctomycetota bacterium]